MVAFGSKTEIRIVTNSVSVVRIGAEAIGSVRVMIIHENFYKVSNVFRISLIKSALFKTVTFSMDVINAKSFVILPLSIV